MHMYQTHGHSGSGQHELTANHWSVSTDVLMSSELDTWVLGSSRVNLQQASLASSPLTPVPGCTLLLALLLASMSTLYLKKNSKDAQGRSRSLQSESGFHEAFDVSPGIPYEEQMHLLAYKSSNHLNSNHVNHTILRGKQLQPDLNPSTGGHTSSFLEVPQSSLALVQTSTEASRAGVFPPFRTSTSTDSPPALPSRASSRSSDPKYHDCKACGCERIRINVSGQYFEARVGMLNRHPDTLLGNPAKRQRFYDRSRDELFLDRHRPSFEAIFSYYQYGGRLKRPHTVPDDIFLSEVTFYELESDVVDEYKQNEGYVQHTDEMPTQWYFRKVWLLFEYPETSIPAFIIALISVLTTLVSIVLFCVETLPVFSMSHCVVDAAPNFLDPFFIIESVCTAWFTLELLIRFIVCPSKIRFWKDFKNIVDATAIIPYYVTLINVVSTMSCASAKSSASLAFLRVIRLVRIFKLTKHSVGLQVLILTFKASIGGLGLFLVALVVCLLVFSSAIYYAEQGIEDTQIHSIPDAFWWAIITMTTVGYGDKVPLGPWGKLLGSICALVGVLTLAIPVPIITGNFNRFYIHKTGRGRQM